MRKHEIIVCLEDKYTFFQTKRFQPASVDSDVQVTVELKPTVLVGPLLIKTHKRL